MEQNLKTINIKGKEYVEVNERINFFRTNEKFAGWSMETEILSLDQESCTLKAVIKNESGRIIATGLAQESKDSSLVNSTSYIENCETSAWGRALANLGIGIKAAIASAEEVNNAIKQQSTNTGFQQKVYQDEIKAFPCELNGQVYDVEYIKKFSKKNNQYFWVLKNIEDEQYFPKYRKVEK